MSERIAYVTIPIAGSVTVAVEDYEPGATDDELFDLALDLLDCRTEDGEHTTWDEWDCFRQISQGNILYAQPNEFSVEREGDES